VRRKGFARKLGWVCYGTLRWVDVRLTILDWRNIPITLRTRHSSKVLRWQDELQFRRAYNCPKR